MLHPGQRFYAHVLWRIHEPDLKLLSPPRPLHQITLLMESILLVKILLVATLLSLNLKVFLGEPPLVAETLANDPDVIQVGFHIGKFITIVVDTEADRLNTKGLLTESESCLNRIKVNSPCIIVYYRLYGILTSSFYSELN
jgi:hypothetical protein